MIDVKWLKGLIWTGSKEVGKKDSDGRQVAVYESIRRELKSEDVISYRESTDEVIIVSSDGKKHRVPKHISKSGG